MHSAGLIVSAAMALTAAAVPFEGGHSHAHHHAALEARHTLRGNGSHFPLHIVNQCDSSKEFAVYQITADYDVVQISATKTIDSGESGTIHAPYTETGLRLSGNADWELSDQIYEAQALFEFGYAGSIEGSQDGLAYDISIMSGSDESIGVHVAPIPNGSGSESCETKTCLPTDCPESQGWTNADQDADGSPADTVCYQGRTAMLVVWCPTTSSSINSTSTS